MLDCRSRIIYERKRDSQVYFVLPVESILGKLPVVPIGDTATIPFAMRKNARDIVDAAFDTSEGSGDGSRWCYINTWALSWSRKRFEKRKSDCALRPLPSNRRCRVMSKNI
jgi:hypothetical protein